MVGSEKIGVNHRYHYVEGWFLLPKLSVDTDTHLSQVCSAAHLEAYIPKQIGAYFVQI
jgi:hypothetical protein